MSGMYVIELEKAKKRISELEARVSMLEAAFESMKTPRKAELTLPDRGKTDDGRRRAS